MATSKKRNQPTMIEFRLGDLIKVASTGKWNIVIDILPNRALDRIFIITPLSKYRIIRQFQIWYYRLKIKLNKWLN